jgi:hypothetical protein
LRLSILTSEPAAVLRFLSSPLPLTNATFPACAELVASMVPLVLVKIQLPNY